MSEQPQGTDNTPESRSAVPEPTTDQLQAQAAPSEPTEPTAPTDSAPAADTVPDVPSPDPSTVPVPGEPEPVAPEPTPEPVAPEPTPEPVVPEPTPEPVVPEPTPEPVVPEPTPEPPSESVAAEPTPEPSSEPVAPEPTAALAAPESSESPASIDEPASSTSEPVAAEVTPEPSSDAAATEPAEAQAAAEGTEPPASVDEPASSTSESVAAEVTPEASSEAEVSEPAEAQAPEGTEPPASVDEPAAADPESAASPGPVAAEAVPEAVVPEPTPEPSSEAAVSEPADPQAAPESSESPASVDEPAAADAVPAAPAAGSTGGEGEAPQSEPQADAPAPQSTPSAPRPSAPKPGPIPSPAALAGRKPAVTPVAPTAPPVSTSDSITFGRVGEDGTVYVRDGEEERAVGSYPETSHGEALAYFARKYDELAANTLLLEQRLEQTDLSAHEAREALKTLRDQIGEANVVGDLPALRERVGKIEIAVKERQRTETERRAQAKAEATQVREALVVEAEALAAADVHQIQWKSASAKMRGMLDEWRNLQKKGPKLDKDVENALWHRLSSARSTFDKGRKAFFSELDTQHAEAKRAKEKLVAEAEALSTSKDWGPTAGAFKRLMQEWRRAGRAQRSDDDALWERFKAAQDSFFNAKDAVVAAENEEFRANLTVKEELLVEAEALVPVKDLEAAKAQLRIIQEKWDEAGKVPREDMSRVEGRLRKVEQAVRDLEEAKWTKTNPELNARAQSMVDQLERAVQGLEQDLEAAKASGNDKKIAEAQAALDARRQWLDSARGGLSEFGG